MLFRRWSTCLTLKYCKNMSIYFQPYISLILIRSERSVDYGFYEIFILFNWMVFYEEIVQELIN